MIALEWNIGIDTYTVSPVPSPNRPASIRPGTAIFPWVRVRGQLEPVQRQHRDVHRRQPRRVAGLGQHVLAVGPDYVPGQGFPAPDRVERDEYRARERAPAQQEGEFGHVVGEHPDVERPAWCAPRAQRGGVSRALADVLLPA